ncbi:hypothetical protein ACJMK2_043115 [Sinanodonta woodiana]|uniref:Uncharacterized protein n=1 Tax=Sinanodonta woodiana TaxID=1069815 RepID=A0ABD3VXN0_SINWO
MPEPSTAEEQNQFLPSLASFDEPCVGLSAFKEYSDCFVSLWPKLTFSKLSPSYQSNSAKNEKTEGVDLNKMCDLILEQLHVRDAQVANQKPVSVWHVGNIMVSIASDYLRTILSKPSPSII